MLGDRFPFLACPGGRPGSVVATRSFDRLGPLLVVFVISNFKFLKFSVTGFLQESKGPGPLCTRLDNSFSETSKVAVAVSTATCCPNVPQNGPRDACPRQNSSVICTATSSQDPIPKTKDGRKVCAFRVCAPLADNWRKRNIAKSRRSEEFW